MKCVSYHEWRCQLSVPLAAAQTRAVRSWGTSSPYAGRSSWCPAPYDEIFIIYWHKKTPKHTHTYTAQEERMWGNSCNTSKSTGERGEGGRRPAIELSEKLYKDNSAEILCSTVFTLSSVTRAECKQKQGAHVQIRREMVWSLALVKCWFFGRVLLESPRVL